MSRAGGGGRRILAAPFVYNRLLSHAHITEALLINRAGKQTDLGPVAPEPIKGGGEVEDTEERRSGFLVAGGDRSPLLQPRSKARAFRLLQTPATVF
jgi:hypothetical protein